MLTCPPRRRSSTIRCFSMSKSGASKLVVNFGRNISFRPAHVYTPRSEEEVLEILREHRGKQIRAVGRLHAWSPGIATDQVLLDLRYLNSVQVEDRGSETWGTVGGGCQMKHLLHELDRRGLTTPSVGLITEQTIAGATATGTHGSGKHSLSHYLEEVRVACYDLQTGEPVIRTITQRPELLAARCSLGCLGIVVSASLRCRPQYRVEEHARFYRELSDVLASEAEFPLQQFYLLPWLWQYIVHHRREVVAPRSWLAPLYRLYCFLTLDVGLHLAVLLFVKLLRSRRGPPWFFRWLFPWLAICNWKVVDKSYDMLVMEHELFRHIEVELFVRRSQLPAAMSFVSQVLCHFRGERDVLLPGIRQQLADLNLLSELESAAGQYVHHYPICVRRVLPDDTLISMASGGTEDHYAISLISYAWPPERASFFRFAQFMTKAMGNLFQARPHWGKVCEIDLTQAEALYPRLKEFQEICLAADQAGVFRNQWLQSTLFSPVIEPPSRPMGAPAFERA